MSPGALCGSLHPAGGARGNAPSPTDSASYASGTTVPNHLARTRLRERCSRSREGRSVHDEREGAGPPVVCGRSRHSHGREVFERQVPRLHGDDHGHRRLQGSPRPIQRIPLTRRDQAGIARARRGRGYGRAPAGRAAGRGRMASHSRRGTASARRPQSRRRQSARRQRSGRAVPK